MSSTTHTNPYINPDPDNVIFHKAARFVCETNENLFLTGKAGSGKTTFLKYIRRHTNKSNVVVAPTGIAAINAGGETIHSFLQLPLGPFIPGNKGGFGHQASNVEDKHSLLEKQKLRDSKIKIIQKLELLIIDEVSMVRADLLDAMDLVLRHVRRQYGKPFGGVQVLFIGDMFQLPPVAQPEDWEILREYYPGTYFFDSVVIRQNPPLYIELNKVYRQKDQIFIELLNRIRTGHTLQSDIDTLNRHYEDDDRARKGYIILCTHNRIADTVNREELDKLPSTTHVFKGVINNDFNLKNLPTDLDLELKEGAQIMFIKNDIQTPRRYYNGKIGTVTKIDENGIKVNFPGEPDSDALLLEKEKWTNIKYSIDRIKGDIIEEEMGSFMQYPIRLAWAITVHKSQGLTLERAVVDLNRSFASGQVYVALSRCTSIEGLILRSHLTMDNVIVDPRVSDFANMAQDEDEIDAQLELARKKSNCDKTLDTFVFTELAVAAEKLRVDLIKRKTGPVQETIALSGKMIEDLKQVQVICTKFHRQIKLLFDAGEFDQIQERAEAGAKYFIDTVLGPMGTEIDEHIKFLSQQAGTLKQVKAWQLFKAHFVQKQKAVNTLLPSHGIHAMR